jgi:hypothetical protein
MLTVIVGTAVLTVFPILLLWGTINIMKLVPEAGRRR